MEKWGRRADRVHAAALASHVACCGAPIVLNALVVAFGAGLFASVAPWVTATHDFIHGREIWFIGVSATVLAACGVVQVLSWREDRRAAACGHDSCAAVRAAGTTRRFRVFALVCVLFLVNLGLFAWHRSGAPVDDHRAAVAAVLQVESQGPEGRAGG